MKTTKEIIVIGGGVMGLAIAIDLKLRGADVTVISRDVQQAASWAAAGMLAPMAEQIADSAMLKLCLKSRWAYPEWTRKLEDITGMATNYLPCGILAPVIQQADIAEEQEKENAVWLDRQSIQFYQPGLGQDVLGGWWYPEDGQVDNRSLMQCLIQTTKALGIDVQEGVTVHGIQQRKGKVTSIFTSQEELEAAKYVLATGSWSSQLLPIPTRPVKGQMLCLRMPNQANQPYPLQKVLYGDNIYLVPRQDGRLIIGATVEEVGWTPHNTPQGIQNLLQKAMQLYPGVANWQIEDFWWGFRPGTPDELPILGHSPCENLYLATGHYRNGILLAPVTAALIANLILEGQFDPLLSSFSWQRFTTYDKDSQRTNSIQGKNQIMLNGSANYNGQGNQATFLQIGAKATTTATPQISNIIQDDKPLVIAGRTFNSRLMTGTGKYASIEAMQQSIAASGCDIVTVAVRRVQTKAAGHEGLAEAIDWQRIWMLPNTAGCKTAEEAIRVARLGREMAKLLGQENNNFVKLEVIPDPKYLLPDPIGTLEAAEQLVKEGFAVLPYINADPLLAKRLEEAGCATVMPLGSPIGSGQGIKNTANIAIIIEQSKIPVVVDAGIGTPSEAAQAMEMGADALLINSAIAMAQNAPAMAQAMGLAAIAGRLAYLAGRIPVKQYASASSPLTGTIS
ncbi:Bifunctional protein ThiO/ThiG [Hyella patelloides LEGE 07179]|uniref:Thiazole synthase n=1 Tax=Hyella patelloides LEGE 07179 TaxID=945734 RepID=A0A563VN57_9CYAN|nr:glycine oxidase ThiO [Hyella patelloides]VEP12773.1 Bifunctional protein ThiO/ThiG [Hyella patelloides LEGE 07179]